MYLHQCTKLSVTVLNSGCALQTNAFPYRLAHLLTSAGMCKWLSAIGPGKAVLRVLGGRELISASMAAYGSVINSRQREQSAGRERVNFRVHGSLRQCYQQQAARAEPGSGGRQSRALRPCPYGARWLPEVLQATGYHLPSSPCRSPDKPKSPSGLELLVQKDRGGR